MRGRRVVVTGIGIVSSIGIGREAFCEALQQGRSGISDFRGPNTLGFPFKLGGEVHAFDPRDHLERLDPDDLGRTSQLAVAASRLALRDSGLDLDGISKNRCAVSIGTTDGESKATDDLVQEFADRDHPALAAKTVDRVPANRVASSVAREFELEGDNLTISTACAAGNYAIGNAFDLLRLGEADVVIGGGAESMARKSLAGFYRLGAIADDTCRPFDSQRSGIIAGEGSAVVILEVLERARARGARIYGEVLGYGLSCDAKHSTSPDEDSIVLCMERAHANSGIRPADISYICAHGTGTKVNDALEASAIRRVFGETPPPVSSIKSMLGHTMGAASAMGAAASLLAISEGFLPPTINSRVPDPECRLDIVPNQARKVPVDVVQNNGFAFGGNNAILVLRRVGADS